MVFAIIRPIREQTALCSLIGLRVVRVHHEVRATGSRAGSRVSARTSVRLEHSNRTVASRCAHAPQPNANTQIIEKIQIFRLYKCFKNSELEEMAALPAGVQYGLSSDSCYEDNKELVLVQLTDSALKAIEHFLRSNGNGLAKPQIQFLQGNEGKISIPAPNSGSGPSGEATFKFSFTSNAEMVGGQGSFECITSGGARRLESCGPLPRSMSVRANDDSHVATEDRMASAVAAEQNKCTGVIDEPHKTDIGGRRRRRVSVRTVHPCSHFQFDFVHLAERAVRAQRSVKRERPERAQRPVPPATPALTSDSAKSLAPRASPSACKRPISAGGLASLPAGALSTARGAAAAASVSLLPDDDEHPHKKRRISHYRRPSPPTSGYATTSSGERQAEDNDDERTNVKTEDSGYTLNCGSTVKELGPRPVPDESLQYLESIERSSWIQTQYPAITSYEIRRAYKDEFEQLYPEYRSLHRRLWQVVAHFTRLEAEYRSAHPLSVESAKRRIEDEYARFKNDTSYNQEKRCYNHLHSKLAHIKLRVSEYDNKRKFM